MDELTELIQELMGLQGDPESARALAQIITSRMGEEEALRLTRLAVEDPSAPGVDALTAVLTPAAESIVSEETEDEDQLYRQQFDDWVTQTTGIDPRNPDEALFTDDISSFDYLNHLDEVYAELRKQTNAFDIPVRAFTGYLDRYFQTEASTAHAIVPDDFIQEETLRRTEKANEERQRVLDDELQRKQQFAERAARAQRERFFDFAKRTGLLPVDASPERLAAVTEMADNFMAEVTALADAGLPVNTQSLARLRVSEANLAMMAADDGVVLEPTPEVMAAQAEVQLASLEHRAAVGAELSQGEKEQLESLRSQLRGALSPEQIAQRDQILSGFAPGEFDRVVTGFVEQGLPLEQAIARANEEFGIPVARPTGIQVGPGFGPPGGFGPPLPAGAIPGPDTARFLFGEEPDLDEQSLEFFNRLVAQGRDPQTGELPEDELAFLNRFVERQDALRHLFEQEQREAGERRTSVIEARLHSVDPLGARGVTGNQVNAPRIPTFSEFLENRLPAERGAFRQEQEAQQREEENRIIDQRRRPIVTRFRR